MSNHNAIPSFNAAAEVVGKALAALDKAAGKSATAIAVAMNAYLDTVRGTDLAKDQAGTEALMAEVRGCQTMVDMVASGLILQDTANKYAQGMGRAFFHGAEWTPRAYQSIDRGGIAALPWSKGAKTPAKPVKASKGEAEGDTPSDTVAPADEVAARAYMVRALETIHAYARKHGKVLDLTSRDVAEQCGRLADTLKAIDGK